MLHRKWCCICYMFCLRKLSLQRAQRLYHHVLVAVLSTYCKIDFFCEVMFEHHHLVALSWCPSFFLMATSGAGIRPTVGQVALCCTSTREWKCLGWHAASSHSSYTCLSGSTDSITKLRWKLEQVHRFVSTSLLPVCSCYDGCSNAHVQYTTGKLVNTSYVITPQAQVDVVVCALMQHNCCQPVTCALTITC